MKSISILVYEYAVLTAIAGSLEILSGTNRFLRNSGRPAAFRVELVGVKIKHIRLMLPVQFICQTDLNIVHSFDGDPAITLKKNHQLIE